MRTRAIAAIELVLILPAALFMTALVLRNLPQFEHGAQQLVMWYARRMWSWWVLLLGLPVAVLVRLWGPKRAFRSRNACFLRLLSYRQPRRGRRAPQSRQYIEAREP